MASPIEAWHHGVNTMDDSILNDILDKNAVFFSPVVYKPQQGKAITKAYLSAAFRVFQNNNFHYVKEIIGDGQAMLEFNVEIDGIMIDGVDIISWNEAGKITEFKVMVRPLQAVNKLHQMMGEMLQQLGQKPPK